ncbi:hypothetical protein [Chitinophaga pinensis]|uniref:Uncharacterized protein n=1 Tax=Chitinophaga pinensis (strain ATCC 43595 / DSM 2588 / LMG 13176 / NBRC 15968 / NCIMB 11800 / UQM 2034) TaxID=485918 RepID=A0A979G837_CHIPD|nr:hypothetical protein [Chitinophaga pinensis]ACU62535.1 hypothetical protein Cpin_5103 [Chitinophaga pinensis DSM 2588]
MITKKLKQILLWAGGISVCLIVVLAVHIYMVTRPKPPGANTRIMARIDIRQDISQQDADKISAWLYQQKGVDRVMVNPATAIVVFTFFPVKTNAGNIVSDFQTTFHYPAQRYVPSEEEMKSGCPAMAQSFTAKLSGVFKHIF